MFKKNRNQNYSKFIIKILKKIIIKVEKKMNKI